MPTNSPRDSRFVNRQSEVPRVLHVVESYGGGVASSIARYVQNTSELEHHLLCNVRSDDFREGGEFSQFQTVRKLRTNAVKAVRDIRAAVRELKPSVLHTHSSFGGAYARISVKATRNLAIVYTPHGYAFERRDIGAIARKAYFGAEWVLSRNTTTIAACSPREKMLSNQFAAKSVKYVPNVSTVGSARGEAGSGRTETVVALGRIAPQRDPEYFLRFAKAISEKKPSVNLVWVGSGNLEDKARIEDSGVHVTGWLSQPDATAKIQNAAVYVHTAAWDGFPMSILEAQQLGLAVVARDIPALKGAPHLVKSPEEMAASVSRILEEPAYALRVQQDWSLFLRQNNDGEQRRTLLEVYGLDR